MPGRKVILVVEDEGALQKVLQMRLQIEGFDVDCASDGQEALDAIARRRPDLVLTDLMMPGMDGAALTGAIKADPKLRSIPVLVLTALREQREKDHLLGLGADAFASKPFSSTELTSKIHELLGEP